MTPGAGVDNVGAIAGAGKAVLSRRQLIQGTGAAALASGMAAIPFTSTRAFAQSAWDRETDVVVVGTGAAGTPAAIEAARAGAQVLRLEKVEVVGGNMSHSQGIIYLGGGTELQKKHGIEDTVDGMVAYLEAFMSPWDDPAFIRYYAENAVEHYNWLVNEGVPFGQEFYPRKYITPPDGAGGLTYVGNEPNYPYNVITEPVPRGHCVAGYGAAMSKALQASADAEPNITTEVNAPVSKLITNEEGRVIGVVAEIGGQEQHILARKGVILASGGYEMNDAMLENTRRSVMTLVPAGSAYRGNTGDGIRMAGALGARLRDMDTIFGTQFVYPPEEKCKGILVNGQGRRFVNEASYGAVIGWNIIHEEEGTAWLILDSAVAEEVEANGGDVSSPFASAETIEELAELLGVPGQVLAAELATYNQFAVDGTDPLFHKEERFVTPLESGPYLAFDLGQTGYLSFLTTGHVEIDMQARVLDQEGNVIPGLYAAGQNGAGIGRRQYNSGVRLGEGSFFGRVAGKTAAAAEPWTGDTETIHITNTTAYFAIPPASASATPQAEVAESDIRVTVEAVDIAFTESELTIPADTDVTIELINNGLAPHDLAIEDTEYKTPLVDGGESATVTVNLPAGEYTYYCTVPGHRQSGMVGTLIVQ